MHFNLKNKIITLFVITTLFFCHTAKSQISYLQEIKGTSSIPFIFQNYNQITNGITLGSKLNAYTEFRIIYKDTTTSSSGWKLTVKAINEFEPIFGIVNEDNDVDLFDIELYVGIKKGTGSIEWESTPITPNTSEKILLTGIEKDLTANIYIYYFCQQLKGRSPNQYNTLFDFNLSPKY